MTNLAARLERLESRAPAKGAGKLYLVGSQAEADRLTTQKRASGEIGPNDDLMCILTAPAGWPRAEVVE